MPKSSGVEIFLQLEGVGKSYRMGEIIVPALKRTDLQIYQGEFLMVLGPSGSGKTTLLNLVGAVDTPTEGHIYFQGDDLTKMGDDGLTAYRRYQVGFVFQFFNLIPTLTALENVELVAELVNDPLDPREVLNSVDLLNQANHFPSELSGGEQQRVAIARALVKHPRLLLADEPTGNLDFETGIRVMSTLTQLARTGDITVIVVSHNNALSAISDRNLRMRSGEIISVEENLQPQDPSTLTW